MPPLIRQADRHPLLVGESFLYSLITEPVYSSSADCRRLHTPHGSQVWRSQMEWERDSWKVRMQLNSAVPSAAHYEMYSSVSLQRSLSICMDNLSTPLLSVSTAHSETIDQSNFSVGEIIAPFHEKGRQIKGPCVVWNFLCVHSILPHLDLSQLDVGFPWAVWSRHCMSGIGILT